MTDDDLPTTPPATAGSALTTSAVLRYQGVRTLMATSTLLYGGVALQAAALFKQAYDITGNEADLGWIGLCEFLPAAAFVLITGQLADRVNRRVMALVAISIELLATVALVLYALSEPTRVWPLFVIAFTYGVGRAFAAPALRSMPPMVAPDGALPKVIALYSATWTGASIVGPAVSGLLYAAHPAAAYSASGLLVAAAMFTLGRVRFLRQPDPIPAGQRPTLRSAVEGLVFIRRTPVLLAAISLDLFAVLFGGAVALLPAIAEERLGAGDVGYGFLRAAPGIGAAIMAVALAARPVSRRVGRTLLWAVAVFGVGTVVLGLTRSYVVAFAALVVLSAADMVSVFIRGSIVPLVTPDEKRGRVLAVENVFIGASNELGAFESGMVAQAVGTPATVVGGGLATVVIVGVFWVGFPALRNVDRFDDLGT